MHFLKKDGPTTALDDAQDVIDEEQDAHKAAHLLAFATKTRAQKTSVQTGILGFNFLDAPGDVATCSDDPQIEYVDNLVHVPVHKQSAPDDALGGVGVNNMDCDTTAYNPCTDKVLTVEMHNLVANLGDVMVYKKDNEDEEDEDVVATLAQAADQITVVETVDRGLEPFRRGSVRIPLINTTPAEVFGGSVRIPLVKATPNIRQKLRVMQ